MSAAIDAIGRLGPGHGLLLFLVLLLTFVFTFDAITRCFRTVMVLCRGWPPAHLAADGDWRPVANAEDGA